MKLANPAPLGLFGFALTSWLLGMVNAGWFGDTALPLVLAMGFAFGGTTQFCAGLLAMPRGDTFGFTAFCSFGAFWLSWALFDAFYAASVPPAFVGWYLFLWGVFTAVMWVGTFRANRATQLTFLGAIFTFFFLAAGEWTAMPLLHQLGGYAGMLTGALAFYLGSAQVIDEVWSSDVLPLGLYQRPIPPGSKMAVAAKLVQGAL